MDTSEGISIVVPTINRHTHLNHTVKCLLKQNHKPIEIIIVEQSAAVDPETQRLATENPEIIRLHHVSFRGLPTARNFGWQKSRYPYVIYVDDDIDCGPNLASEHLRNFRQNKADLSGGGFVEPHKPQQPYPADQVGEFNQWTATPVEGFQYEGEKPIKHVRGCNFAVKREWLEKLNGFDETLNVGAALYEELEFCLRAASHGAKIYFNGKARLDHLVAPTGGCRVPDIKKYMWSLAHNRCLIIGRHLPWYCWATALARLGILETSYFLSYKDLKAYAGALTGMIKGLQAGLSSPKLSVWK